MSLIYKNNFDGFTIKIFQDEDGDWLAHFIELPNVSAFADTAHAALDELELAWSGVKESYRKHGENIPTSKENIQPVKALSANAVADPAPLIVKVSPAPKKGRKPKSVAHSPSLASLTTPAAKGKGRSHKAIESASASLPALQNHLQGFIAEYEDKAVQARTQLSHVEALLGILSNEIPQNKPNRHEVLGYSSQKTLKTKRQSLFGSDKDKIVIGEKFNEPLT